MELRSPSEDPYKSWRKAKDALNRDGFSDAITILEPSLAKAEGKEYHPEDFQIHDVYRFLSQDSYLSDESGEFVPKILLALKANDGNKFVLEYFFKAPYQETVMEFMAKVDAADETQKIFQ